MAKDCCMGDCDAMNQIELPFGDTIVTMSEPNYPPGYGCKHSRAPGLSPAGGDENSPLNEVGVHAYARNMLSSDGGYSECDLETFRPLQYARRHGLTRNYLNQIPLDGACISRLRGVSKESNHCEFKASEQVSAKAAIEQAIDDRWDIDKDTAEMLSSILALSRPNDFDEETDTVKVGDLKIDEPVLTSAPNMDVARFRARNAIRISITGMKPYALDIDKDEGLKWPSEYLKLPSSIAKIIAKAKLDIDQDTARALEDAMKEREADTWKAVEDATADSETRKLRGQTPPLLPHSPPHSPHCIFDETCEMELTSTPENVLDKDRVEAEAQFFGVGKHERELSGCDPPYAELEVSDDVHDFTHTPMTSSSSPLRRKRRRDLKVETPLLHSEPGPSPVKRMKTVSFPEELCMMIPDGDTDDRLAGSDALREDIIPFIAEVAAPRAQAVIDQIANEQLDELDTTLRLDVPTVDIIEPIAPWVGVADDGTRIPPLSGKVSLARLEKEMAKDIKKWSGVSKIDRLLSWTPFPRHLGKISVDEQFDDGSCERYMAELSLFDATIDIGVLLWKQAGVRLLDPQDSDDEDLESGSVGDDDKDASMGDIVKRRVDCHPSPTVQPPLTKLPQVHDPPLTAKSDSGRKSMQALLQRRKLKLEAAHSSKTPEVAVVVQTTDGAGGLDVQSHSTLLAGLGTNKLLDFIGLQGAKMSETQSSKRQHQPTEPLAPPPAAMEQAGLGLPYTSPPHTLPCPTTSTPGRAMSVVISSSMLANRSLTREIQAQLPTLEMIERDPGSLTAIMDKSLRPCEADFTLSPSTGLVCTTLQKLKQKPLPGQRNYFGVRERIATISVRYELLIVLVSEGRQDDLQAANALDERDTAAVNDLIGFVASLESSVEVCYVAGGERDLAKWTAARILRHCVVDEDAKLLHDETIWERLLRSAGANPSAAQMILAKLKCPPDAADPSESSSTYGSMQHGLAALVQMPAGERLQRFGPAMGGERVLEKISTVIDGGWMPASRQ